MDQEEIESADAKGDPAVAAEASRSTASRSVPVEVKPEASPLLIPALDVSRLLGISLSMFYSLSASGRIGPRPISLGRRRLYRRDEVTGWVSEGCPPLRQWEAMRISHKSCR